MVLKVFIRPLALTKLLGYGVVGILIVLTHTIDSKIMFSCIHKEKYFLVPPFLHYWVLKD